MISRRFSTICRTIQNYKTSTRDENTSLIDLGKIAFETADGQHPTAAGHRDIYNAALPAFNAVMKSDKCQGGIPPETFSLWQGQAPAGDGSFEKISDSAPNLHTPATITVFRPVKGNGAAVVICPGGGYAMHDMSGAEGAGSAMWLNKMGVIGVVLNYRLPHGRCMAPLLDAQRAIRMVRSKAGDWGCDVHRIGILGFSAGGHLASAAATHFDAGDPKAADPVNGFGCRPDFALLVYPVITMGEKSHGGSKLNLLGPNPAAENIEYFSNERQVTSLTPPCFLAHAANDTVVPPENSRQFHEALRAHHVPSHYLELPSGEHGLNGYKGPMWDAWLAESEKWMAEQLIISNP